VRRRPAHLDGVLGADALTGRPLLLDVGRSRLVVGATRRDVAGEEVALTLVEGRPAITLDVAAGSGQRSGSLLLVLDSTADQLVLFGGVAARRPRSGGDRLTTLAGSLAAAVGPPPRFAGIRRPPRRALLLAEVVDRREDGLLPLAAVGPDLLDRERGIAVLDARRRR
jgi:hypothetical protein